MDRTTFILWVVFGISIVALVVMQVRSMLAAMRVGGKSSRSVVMMRTTIVVALLGLFGYVVYRQVTL